MEEKHPRLVQVEHATYEQAVAAAAQEAATTMSVIAPAVMYRQGTRDFLTTSFPLSYIAERVNFDTLSHGGNASDHYNRPLIAEHHRAITEYLITQDDYVLPPLSLCAGQELRCHVMQSSSAVKLGIVVIPTSMRYNITDGQHRSRGIQDAIQQKQSLADDGIGVTLVVETDPDDVHQIFYDCAQTRSIAPSLLTAYNRRDYLARLVREVCKEVPVFTGRIEQVSKTVGKSSINLFTLNQVRVGTAELLTGDSTQTGVSLKKDIDQRLGSPEAEQEHRKWVVDFYNAFTLANPQWSQLLEAGNPALGTVDTSLLRHGFVHCTGTGLVVLGRVGYAIRNYPSFERDKLIEALGKEIDWSRDAAIWQGNVVTNGRMNTLRMPVDLAVMGVKEKLGIPLTEQDKRRASRRSYR